MKVLRATYRTASPSWAGIPTGRMNRNVCQLQHGNEPDMDVCVRKCQLPACILINSTLLHKPSTRYIPMRTDLEPSPVELVQIERRPSTDHEPRTSNSPQPDKNPGSSPQLGASFRAPAIIGRRDERWNGHSQKGLRSETNLTRCE